MISVNEQLAKDLHKPVIKKFNNNNKKPQKNPEKSLSDLKIIFGQQIQLKCNHCLQRIKMLHICVWQIFSPNIHGLNLYKIKKWKTVLNAFIKIVNESNRKPNKIWIDQENFTINLCKNG